MPLIGLLLASGAIYAGLKTYLQPAPAKAREDEPPVASPSPESQSAWITQLDEKYQTFIQQQLDPLLAGQTRQQQLTVLAEGRTPPAISQVERQNNRYLGLAGVIMGTALVGFGLFPPLLLPTVVMVAYLMLPLYQQTFQSLLHEKRLTLELLASLYMTGFWLAGYYIFGGLALLLYFLGNKIVFQMEGRSRENLTHLFGQQPREVWQLIDGVEVSLPFDQLQVGDVIVVHAGEPIPVDGVIVAGLASIDQQMLTGESQPVEKGVGETVLAATLLLNGRLLQIRVERAGTQTIAAQIGQLLNQTAEYHTATEAKGTALANR